MADGTGVATLGYPGGTVISFRINPQSVQWKFDVAVNVTDTTGGQVVQVVGADLSDLIISGQYGQLDGPNGKMSMELAEDFYTGIRTLAEQQSLDAQRYGKMQEPMEFTFPLRGWRFGVYIKSLVDPDGGSVSHRTPKFSYSYQLTLAIQEDRSSTMNILGTGTGDVQVARDEYIKGYIGRISQGMGWVHSEIYNGRLTAGADVTARGVAETNEENIVKTDNAVLGGTQATTGK